MFLPLIKFYLHFCLILNFYTFSTKHHHYSFNETDSFIYNWVFYHPFRL